MVIVIASRGGSGGVCGAPRGGGADAGCRRRCHNPALQEIGFSTTLPRVLAADTFGTPAAAFGKTQT
jgi:hypothetical protein